MIGWLRTRVRKQSIIALYFEFETVLKFYNLEARNKFFHLDGIPKHLDGKTVKITKKFFYKMKEVI